MLYQLLTLKTLSYINHIVHKQLTITVDKFN